MDTLEQLSAHTQRLHEVAKRDALPALQRGLRNRCPACGHGRILHSYLKVNEACSACGEEFHHHRADDFPPYLTMFVVGHIVGVIYFAVSDLWPNLPIAYHYAVWPLLAVILSLWLLPIFKGMLIAYQWALRMHGFETQRSLSLTSREFSTDIQAKLDTDLRRSAA